MKLMPLLDGRMPDYPEKRWEVIAKSLDVEGHFADANLFDPQPSTKDGVTQIYGMCGNGHKVLLVLIQDMK